jgi:hypothetical protein
VGFYEDKRDGTVANAMAKYGMAMTLVVPAEGTYDPDTGAFTPGSDKTYAVRGLNGTYKKSRKGDITQAKSRFVYLSASGLAVEPTPNHKLRVSGVDYEILDVEPLTPGGITVMYQLQVQQP